MSHQEQERPQKYHTQQCQKASQQPNSAEVQADLFGDTWVDIRTPQGMFRLPIPPELLVQVIGDLLVLLSPEQVAALDRHLGALESLRSQRNG